MFSHEKKRALTYMINKTRLFLFPIDIENCSHLSSKSSSPFDNSVHVFRIRNHFFITATGIQIIFKLNSWASGRVTPNAFQTRLLDLKGYRGLQRADPRFDFSPLITLHNLCQIKMLLESSGHKLDP